MEAILGAATRKEDIVMVGEVVRWRVEMGGDGIGMESVVGWMKVVWSRSSVTGKVEGQDSLGEFSWTGPLKGRIEGREVGARRLVWSPPMTGERACPAPYPRTVALSDPPISGTGQGMFAIGGITRRTPCPNAACFPSSSIKASIGHLLDVGLNLVDGTTERTRWRNVLVHWLRDLVDGYGNVEVVCVSCRHDLTSMRQIPSGFARSSVIPSHSRSCSQTDMSPDNLRLGMYLSRTLKMSSDAF